MQPTILALWSLFLPALLGAAERPLPAEVRKSLEASDGLAAPRFALAASLPESAFPATNEALQAAGYQPTRVRPYQTNQGVRLAAVWQRGAPAARVRLGLTAAEVAAEDERLRSQQYERIDVAGYVATAGRPAIRHAAVWAKTDKPITFRSYCEVPSGKHSEAYQAFREDGLAPVVLQHYAGPDGTLYVDAIWRPTDVRWRFNWDTRPKHDRVRAEVDADYEQVDVAISRRDYVNDTVARARTRRQTLDGRLAGKSASAYDLLERGIACFWLGDDEAAVRDLTASHKLAPTAREGSTLRFRALTHARAGRRAEAQADLEAFAKVNTDRAEQACLRALVAGLGGRVADATEQLQAEDRRANGDVASTLATARAAALLAAHLLPRDRAAADRLAARAVAPLRRYAARGADVFGLVESYDEFGLLARHPQVAALRAECGCDRYLGAVWQGQVEWESRAIHDLTPKEHAARARTLAAEGWQPVALAAAQLSPDRSIVASLWRRRWPAEVLTARKLYRKALALEAEKDNRAAAETMRQVIELRKRHLGLPHGHTRQALRDRAIFLARAGRWDEAVDQLLEALASLQAAPYPDASLRDQWQDTVDDWLGALVYQAVRRADWPAAIAHAARQRELAVAHFGADYWRTRDATEVSVAVKWRAGASAAVQAELREADELIDRVRQFISGKRYVEALPLAARAVTLRVAHPDVGSREVLAARLWHARTLQEAGRQPEAATVLRQAIADRRAAGRADGPVFGYALRDLSIVEGRSGDLQVSVRHATEAVEVLRQARGEKHADYQGALEVLARAHRRLAVARHQAGDYTGATTSWARASEAYALRHGHNHAEAREADWRRWQDYWLTLWGPEEQARYRETLAAWQKAIKLAETGKTAEAREGFQQVLTRLQKLLGRDRPDVVDVSIWLGDMQARQNDAQAAAASYRGALAVLERQVGPGHEKTRTAMDRLCLALNHLAETASVDVRPDDLEKARAEILTVRRKQYPEDHWRVVEARAALEDARRVKALPPDRRARLVRANAWRQEALKAQAARDWTTALDRIGQALAAYRELLGPDHGDTGVCVRWMAQFFYQQDNPARALQLIALEAGRLERRLGPSHPEVAARLRELGILHGNLGENAAAAGAYRELADVLAARRGDSDWRVTDVRLSRTLCEQLAADPALARAAQRIAQLQKEVRTLAESKDLTAALARAGQLESAVRAGFGSSRWLPDALAWQARVLTDLKRRDEADRAQRAAAALYARVLGPAHPDTLDAEISCATLAEARGDWTGAVERLRTVVATARALSVGDPARARATAALLGVLERWGDKQAASGDYQAARATLASAAEAAAEAHGETDYRAVNLGVRRDYYELLAGADAGRRDRLRRAEAIRDRAWADYQANHLAEAIHGYREARRQFLTELSADHPFTASVTYTLAWMSQEAGDYKSAEELHREALRAREKSLPPDHVDRAYSLTNLGWLLQALGEPKKAEALHRQALQIVVKVLGNDHPEAANILTRLGSALQDERELDQAEESLLRARQIYQARYGERHRDVAVVDNNLGLLAQARKQYAKAERLLARAADVLREQQSGNAAMYALTLANLGNCYLEQGRYADAEAPLSEALRLRRTLLGDGHPQTVQTMQFLAQAYAGLRQSAPADLRLVSEAPAGTTDFGTAAVFRSQTLAALGEFDPAVEALRTAWAARRQALGPDHPLTAVARNNLIRTLDRRAKAREQRNEFAGAAADFQEVARLLAEVVGAADPRIVAVQRKAEDLNRIANLPAKAQAEWRQARADARRAGQLGTEGKPAAALALFKSVRETYARLLGEQGYYYAWMLTNLGNTASSAGRREEAEAYFARALRAHEQLFGRHHYFYARQLHDLGRHFWSLNDHVRAEPLFREEVAIYRELGMTGDEDYLGALRGLAAAADLGGDSARARALLGEALDRARVVYGELHSEYATILSQRAGVEREQGNFRLAFNDLHRAVEILTRVKGADDDDTVDTLNQLGGTYSRASYLFQAEKVLRDVIARRTRRHGAEHDLVRKARGQLNNLLSAIAEGLFDQGRYADSLRYWREVETLRAELFGADDWKAVNARTGRRRAEAFATQPDRVAAAAAARQKVQESHRLDALGRYEDAIRLQKEILAVLEPFLGADHPDVADAYDWLARAHRLKGDQAAAEDALRKAVAIARKSIGLRHPTTASYLGHLALVRTNRGDFAEALQLRQEAVQVMAAAHGRGSAEERAAIDRLIETARQQVDGLREQGEYAEAAATADAWRKRVAERHGPGDWRTADADHEVERLRLLARLSSGDRQTLKDAEKQLREATRLGQQEKPVEALKRARAAARAFAAVLGPESRDQATALTQEGISALNAGQLPLAEKRLREAVEMMAGTAGAAHPKTSECRYCLAAFYARAGQPDRAAELYERCYRDQRAAFGPDHANTTLVRKALFSLFEEAAEDLEEAGRFAEAQQPRQRLVGLAARFFGPSHWRTVSARVAAAGVARRARLTQAERGQLTQALKAFDMDGKEALANPRRALALLRPALETIEHLVGPHDRVTIDRYRALAMIAGWADEDEQAESYARKAEELAAATWGWSHPEHALVLREYASAVGRNGSAARGLALMIAARDIRKATTGEQDEWYGRILHDLAWLRIQLGQDMAGRRDMYAAARVFAQTSGVQSADYASCLKVLGGLERVAGNLERADALLVQALKIHEHLEKQKEERDAGNYAETLRFRAMVLEQAGRHGQAAEVYRQAYERHRAIFGKQNLGTVRALAELAGAQLASGDEPGAAANLRQVLSAYRSALELSAGRSEEEQASLARRFKAALDNWLELSARGRVPVEETYEAVLAWKGGVFGMQQRARRDRIQPELFPLLDELDATTSRLAAAYFAPADVRGRPDWEVEQEKLRTRRAQLERELAEKSEPFRQARNRQQVNRVSLQDCLPAGVGFVDVVAADDPDGRVLAFIVRKDQPLAQVDLGGVKELTEQVEHWRRGLGAGAAAERAAAELKKRVWDRLAPRLAGVQTVLVSPEGPLLRVPLAALPGEKPGTYLVESGLAFGVVPAARLLPELLRGKPTRFSGGEQASLLVVGDVDYGADPGGPAGTAAGGRHRSAAREGGESFARLPGTGLEADEVLRLFRAATQERGTVAELRGAVATEQAIRQSAGRYQFYHFATHGFERHPRSSSRGRGLDPAVDESAAHPGRLCGIVLAGANAATRDADRRVVDDGILTALEVADLDFSSAQLVVLSACETGVAGGETTGEGVLGMQRAFQVAGARTCVAALWNVNDNATKVLMDRFYRRLWLDRTAPLEALRQAQLDLLREYRYDPGKDELVRGAAGQRPLEGRAPARLPPEFWAGFVLSGDWR